MNSSAPARQQEALTPQKAAQQLYGILEQGQGFEAGLAQTLQIAQKLTSSLGVIYLERNDEKRLVVRPENYHPQNLGHLKSVLQHAVRLGNVAAAECTVQAGATEADAELMVVAVPVLGSQQGTEALVAALSCNSPEKARALVAYVVQILTWVAAYLAAVRSHARKSETGGVAHSDALMQLPRYLAVVNEESDSRESYRPLADWFQSAAKCNQVMIGLRERSGGACRVVAMSGQSQFDRRSELVGLVEEVMEETLLCHDIQKAGNVPANSSDLLNTEAFQSLYRLDGQRTVHRYPLLDNENNGIGVILCRQASVDNAEAPKTVQADVVALITQLLIGQQKAQPTALQRTLGIGKRTTDAASVPWYKSWQMWLAMASVGLLMLVPMPLKVKTECVLQPRHRRFVSIPYEGRLQQALTRPGHVVQKGQLLAKMDGQDIEFEISTLTADLRRAQKSRDTALAGFETSTAQMAALEAKRLTLQIEELGSRLDHLEVRSPVDGVVVSGDPEKLEGSRFQMGDTLVEVAPLAEMLVELEIPDEDISHVRAGQEVRYCLSSMPLRSFTGEIRAVQPRSETREDANVFIAFVDLPNAENVLKPGMRGRAKIVCDSHPLGWNLFHKAWEKLLSFVAW